MSVPEKDIFNGHPVIRGFPEERIFRQATNEGLKITVNYKGCPNGIADIYMHRKCVKRFGYMPYNKDIPAYNILLVDDKYPVYYDEECDGRFKRNFSGKYLTAEEVYNLAVKTRDFDIKKKATVLPKDNIPRLPITQKYTEDVNYPYIAVPTLEMYAGKY